MIDVEQRIERARAEQTSLAALLRDGHPDKRGIELAISDWFWEELLLQEELELQNEGCGWERKIAPVTYTAATALRCTDLGEMLS